VQGLHTRTPKSAPQRLFLPPQMPSDWSSGDDADVANWFGSVDANAADRPDRCQSGRSASPMR